MYYSPLLYPRGKTRLAKVVASICDENNIDAHYVEPYAGGASVALYLLRESNIRKVTINDSDRSVYAFWHSVFYETDALCNLIEETNVDMEAWEVAKKVQANKSEEDLLTLGFSTFLLNRTEVSEIQDKSIICNTDKEEKYRINSRFNKKPLIKRIHKIAENESRVSVSNLDPVTLIENLQGYTSAEPTIFYFDPRYSQEAEYWYDHGNSYDAHTKLSKAIRSMRNLSWLLSCEDQYSVSNIYGWVLPEQRMEYLLTSGKEVVLFSEDLKVSYFPFQKIR